MLVNLKSKCVVESFGAMMFLDVLSTIESPRDCETQVSAGEPFLPLKYIVRIMHNIVLCRIR